MNLLRAAATVSGMTLVSRVTGLVRDTLMASTFGASRLTDAFWVAFRIPNLLRRLFAEGAFSQAFVPILGEYKTRQGDEETRLLIDKVGTVLAWMVSLLSLGGIVMAPVVVWVLGSGLREANDAAGYQAAVTMTRIMFPYIVCMAMVSLSAAVLNTWRHFTVPALTPVLLNLAMIAGAVWIHRWFDPPVYGLAVAAMLGGLMQVALQIPILRRMRLLPRISFRLWGALKDAGVRRVLRQMLPAMLGVSVAQLSLIINTNIATYLAPGSVTWLQFADRLMEFPTALLGVALGTVLLPSLSKEGSGGDAGRYSDLLDWGLRLTLMLACPAAVGLAMLSEGLTATLFHYGRYSAADVEMTRLAVSAYAIGLLGLVSVKILAPGFYAKQDIKTPVKIAVVVLILTQLMNVVFVPRYQHAGLALSIGLGATINAIWLLTGLIRRGVYRPGDRWLGFIARLAVALLVLAAVLFGVNRYVDWIALNSMWWLRILALLGTVAGGAAAYFLTLYLLGFRVADFRKQA